MRIIIKNKETLLYDDFKFKCCIGKKGSSNNKKEGDNATPRGIFQIGNIYYRADRVKKPITKKNLLSILSKYYKGDIEKATNITEFISTNREEVIKESITRKIS